MYIFYYLLCGIAFNFIYDIIVTILSKRDAKSENLRLTLFERLITTLTWPIPFFKLISGIIKTIIQSW